MRDYLGQTIDGGSSYQCGVDTLWTATLLGAVVGGVFSLLLLHDVIGTGVAGYFLESGLEMGAMALAALGWLIHVTSARRAS